MNRSSSFGKSVAWILAASASILLGAGCSTAPKSAKEQSAPRVKWYAHCESCKWCKGAFKTTQDVQEVVTAHNKQFHDWFKVAYFDQLKCP